jgi:predicted DNA binding CopG/RHH family protein
MGGKKKTIPELRTEVEAREFFDRHGTVDFLEDTLPEQLTVDPDLKERLRTQRERKQMVTLRVSAPHLESVRRIARRKGIPYQTLIQLWIAEGLEREFKEK